MDKNNMTYIGSFSVDSGQAMVGDPCYLDEWEPWVSEADKFEDYKNKKGQYGYLGACEATINNNYGELGKCTSVVFSTGYGDGLYPVYAQLDDNGRVSKILIDFIGDEE